MPVLVLSPGRHVGWQDGLRTGADPRLLDARLLQLALRLACRPAAARSRRLRPEFAASPDLTCLRSSTTPCTGSLPRCCRWAELSYAKHASASLRPHGLSGLRLQAEVAAGAVVGGSGAADVAAGGLQVLVAELSGDGELAGAVPGGLGGVAAAQWVGGQDAGVQAGGAGVALDDGGDGGAGGRSVVPRPGTPPWPCRVTGRNTAPCRAAGAPGPAGGSAPRRCPRPPPRSRRRNGGVDARDPLPSSSTAGRAGPVDVRARGTGAAGSGPLTPRRQPAEGPGRRQGRLVVSGDLIGRP